MRIKRYLIDAGVFKLPFVQGNTVNGFKVIENGIPETACIHSVNFLPQSRTIEVVFTDPTFHDIDSEQMVYQTIQEVIQPSIQINE